jgi:hypothetical protein
MNKPATIGAAELAELLYLSEPQLMELAQRGRLPFTVSTDVDDGFSIRARDLCAWKHAAWLACVSCEG